MAERTELFFTLAEQPMILPDNEEINSFVYIKSTDQQDSNDMDFTLGEIESLWDETVRQIKSDGDTALAFRMHLNEHLRGAFPPRVLDAISDQQTNVPRDIFTDRDVNRLFHGPWLEFP